MTGQTPRTSITSYSRKIRERVKIRAATKLSDRDIALFHDVLAMRFALLHDLVGSHSTVVENWQRTTLGLTSLDVELYSSDWKTSREILTSTAFRKGDGAYAQRFKHAAQSRIHYTWILGSIVGLLEETDSFSVANQWIVFDSKVNLASLDLTTECCSEYLDFEDQISIMDDWPDLLCVRQCAKELFGGFYLPDYPFRPRHGSGATAEVERRDADSWHKNRQFAVDGEVINYLRYRVSESEWRSALYMPYRGLSRTSILVCVPKSMTKNRTISKEPTTLQFLQQDIRQAIDEYFVENLSGRINLHDQSRSRALALQGSADGSYATVDLTCASDSVSVRHIEDILDGLSVTYPLMATRSTHVHVRDKAGGIDRIIKTKKFAPMGSACCSPAQCMIFASLCEAAVRLETGSKSRSYDYVVYNDDIVIKSRYLPRLLVLLEEFGFSVNSEKTFYDDDGFGDTFREACGIEALNGEDITPLRLSRRLCSLTDNDSEHQAGQGVGMVDLLNRAYLYGFTNLHRWINDQLRTYYWFRRLLRVSASDYASFSADIARGLTPWLDVASPFVITDDLHNTQWQCFGTRKVLASPIQQHCARVLTARTERRYWFDPVTGYIPEPLRTGPGDSNDYYTWLVGSVTVTGDPDDLVVDATGVVTLRPRDLRWSKTWVPLPFGTPPKVRLRPAH